MAPATALACRAAGWGSSGDMATEPVTFGVEEEYHLVDEDSCELRAEPEVVRTARDTLGPQAQSELSTTQLEVATKVCADLPELHTELARLRRGADAAARAHGCRILVASTHPLARGREADLTPEPRYRRMAEQWGILAYQQGITGCHVHVGVNDPDVAIGVMDRVRPWLPVLLALTASSPLWEGIDTGYASYRTQWYALWPVSGAPEPLGDRAGYDRVVEELVGTGVVEDDSYLYWDVRPSRRYPTLEFRIGDLCTRLDDAVLYAGLARSLVRVLSREVRAGTPVPPLRAEVLRAARWRAARYGTEGELYDPTSRALAPAAQVVTALLDLLRPDLTDHDEWSTLTDLTRSVLSRGTSAAGQRHCLTVGGTTVRAVARWIIDHSL